MKVGITLSIDHSLLEKLDILIKEKGSSRSEFITNAIVKEMNYSDKPKGGIKTGRKR